MNYSTLEDFQCTLREVILKAEKLKDLDLPNLPVVMPLRVAIHLTASLAPLELLMGKAIDAVAETQLEDGEILYHLGQVIE